MLASPPEPFDDRRQAGARWPAGRGAPVRQPRVLGDRLPVSARSRRWCPVDLRCHHHPLRASTPVARGARQSKVPRVEPGTALLPGDDVVDVERVSGNGCVAQLADATVPVVDRVSETTPLAGGVRCRSHERPSAVAGVVDGVRRELVPAGVASRLQGPSSAASTVGSSGCGQGLVVQPRRRDWCRPRMRPGDLRRAGTGRADVDRCGAGGRHGRCSVARRLTQYAQRRHLCQPIPSAPHSWQRTP